LKYFTEIDFEHHVALVVTLINNKEEEIIGVSRYVELEDKGKEKVSEVVFAIDDAHQHLGLGTLLFEHLVTIAQNNGILKFVADVLLENKKMLEIFEHSDFKLDMTMDHGVIHIYVK
jgi:GNAT superfamily N-acetyltransferase